MPGLLQKEYTRFAQIENINSRLKNVIIFKNIELKMIKLKAINLLKQYW